jgi:mono/diheme cytochrome c family protein
LRKTIAIVVLMWWFGPAGLVRAQESAAKTQAAGEAVREIELPRFQPDLPPGPGREAFAVSCLSCHSTRYVTTQPPMTAAKWEESVRKMIKTYGAPIAEDQVQPIVQYLVEFTKPSRGAASSLAVVTRPAMQAAPDIAIPSDAGARTASANRGKELYVKNCATCHGTSGAGDGPSAAPLLPKPNDLTAARHTSAALAAAITGGVPGTGMPAFPMLSRVDLAALVAYTSQLAPATNAPPDEAATHASIARRLYEQNCANCHGLTGAADGIAAAPLPRPPANFQSVQPTPASALRVITEGVPGTAMPPWKTKLTDEERKALAEYVRSFYGNK